MDRRPGADRGSPHFVTRSLSATSRPIRTPETGKLRWRGNPHCSARDSGGAAPRQVLSHGASRRGNRNTLRWYALRRSEYGESDERQEFDSDEAFLARLREFYDYESRREWNPHVPPEIEAWRFIERQMREGLILSFGRLFRHGHRVVAPAMLFLARAEAREIAAAGRAAIRSGAASQQDHGPARRVIILFAPGAQILAIAARAAGESPGAVGPDAGSPAGAALTAAQKRMNSRRRPESPPRYLFCGIRECRVFRTWDM